MKILYPQEHFSCYNYEKGQNARLEILKREAGSKIVRDLIDTEIVFVIDGHFTLSHAKFIDLDVTKGKILFFPPGSHVEAKVLEDTHIIICRVRGVLQLCECLNLEQLYREYGTKKGHDFHMLDIKERVYSYIEHFVDCVDDGLKCSYYFATKMKELFFLLRAYYTKEELAAFFAPILGKDSQFMNLMYQNYRNVKSVQELASLSMYSPSGFKKQFSKVFGTSASEWLSDQKAALIFQDLNNSPLSFKELADKYGFSSVSSFNNFCLAKFGKPPGKIRQKTTNEEEKDKK
ncbi:AraC family transcriptional regulator [Bacteroides sp. 214]|uniref:AraC family transcriptional regulator n=1 Tax=Bacteroides sp. 214 TaxID=2302935 RepID=UPI0013D1A58C|nr:AraC family transcriptional regulator [Bacteroides sp. 214]NDW11766.1 AraC family transcriptional regulator [Bacteroides sp. 214]